MGLKKARTELRLTQQDMAKHLGVSQQSIARWEGPGGKIPANHLKDLAVLIGCSVNDLLGKSRKTLVDEDSDIPYGTLHIRFRPCAASFDLRRRRDPEASASEVSERDRYFPITAGERRRLSLVLNGGGVSSKGVGWFCFTSLDNRQVFVNARQIERIALVSDDIEAMPSYEHEEVYKLARELAIGDELSEEELENESSPYSKSLLQKARGVLNALGGEDKAWLWFDGVAVDTARGERAFFGLENETLSDLHCLELEGEHAHSDTFVNLYSQGYRRSTLFRLGSLRSIDVAWNRYSEWLAEND
ncbi:hypothetical protein C9I57_30415 [Trinickia symbiotica]|uniref:HTH cro/C1-type domain-containing protein n=1 Tax=Trinickia symbiotica TaxID=863227 RepID=A0A2T3XKF9_9BURK|nr:helix-turn-helix transcriptional regulator [Trinickia symbiotica]PTB17015.1 hypothetical protein C9I57_30415 [Trinickia symbiotica]